MNWVIDISRHFRITERDRILCVRHRFAKSGRSPVVRDRLTGVALSRVLPVEPTAVRRCP